MKLLDRQLLTESHFLKRGPLVCVRNMAGPLRHYLPLRVERLPRMDVVPFRGTKVKNLRTGARFRRVPARSGKVGNRMSGETVENDLMWPRIAPDLTTRP